MIVIMMMMIMMMMTMTTTTKDDEKFVTAQAKVHTANLRKPYSCHQSYLK